MLFSRFTLRSVSISVLFVIGLSSAVHSLALPSARRLTKRGFAELECLGVYDMTKYHHLNHVCEECYQLYRDQTLHKKCRQDCFRNDVFLGCVDALLLSHEQKKLKEMISQLSGRRR